MKGSPQYTAHIPSFLCLLVIFSGCIGAMDRKLATDNSLLTSSPNRSAINNGEEIWARKTAYFSNLYAADYDGVLALVHNRFLGWPDGPWATY